MSENSLHIDGSESTMSDGAAHSTGKGESRIELEATKFCRVCSSSGLLEGIELCGARGRRRGGGGGHHGGDRSEGNEIVRGEERLRLELL